MEAHQIYCTLYLVCGAHWCGSTSNILHTIFGVWSPLVWKHTKYIAHYIWCVEPTGVEAYQIYYTLYLVCGAHWCGSTPNILHTIFGVRSPLVWKHTKYITHYIWCVEPTGVEAHQIYCTLYLVCGAHWCGSTPLLCC